MTVVHYVMLGFGVLAAVCVLGVLIKVNFTQYVYEELVEDRITKNEVRLNESAGELARTKIGDIQKFTIFQGQPQTGKNGNQLLTENECAFEDPDASIEITTPA